MESLTKQQLVILALLVSFVTSIATCVATLALVSQPSAGGVTNTIERVVEETVGDVPSGSGGASAGQAASAASDPLAAAVESVGRSLVTVREYGQPGTAAGFGAVVNAKGDAVTDKSVLAGLSAYGLVYPDGVEYRGAVVESQIQGDLVFLAPADATSTAGFVPAPIGPLPKLGSLAASLGGPGAGILGTGVVDGVSVSGSTTPAISTTIPSAKESLGSPLFDVSGRLLGIRTASLASSSEAEFYPAVLVGAAAPQ